MDGAHHSSCSDGRPLRVTPSNTGVRVRLRAQSRDDTATAQIRPPVHPDRARNRSGTTRARRPSNRPSRRVVVRSGSAGHRGQHVRLAGDGDQSSADLVPAACRRQRAVPAPVGGPQFGLRVEGRRDLLGCRGRQAAGACTGRRLELRIADAAVRADHRVTCRSCPGQIDARSTASGCSRRPAASTAAGSPLMSSGRSRVSRGPGAGDRRW